MNVGSYVYQIITLMFCGHASSRKGSQERPVRMRLMANITETETNSQYGTQEKIARTVVPECVMHVVIRRVVTKWTLEIC